MRKKKLNLEAIQVKSFITGMSFDVKTIKGGNITQLCDEVPATQGGVRCTVGSGDPGGGGNTGGPIIIDTNQGVICSNGCSTANICPGGTGGTGEESGVFDVRC